MQKQALGKGLASLISDDTVSAVKQAYIPNLPINQIVPNQYQPRVEIDPEKLIELADSIREHGVIEPLIVNQNSDNEYELIAGERRWRAAKLAGMTSVPVVVKDSSPQQMLELAIIENIQREDLNALEEAMAFEQLARKFDLTHDEIAKKVGYSRPAVANKIRLLSLPEEVKKGLIEDKLSEGHARALLGLKDEQVISSAYRVVVRDGLSVRATEALVQKLMKLGTIQKKKVTLPLTSTILKIQQDLQKTLKSNVKIVYGKKGGKLTIPFNNEEELEKLHDLLKN